MLKVLFCILAISSTHAIGGNAMNLTLAENKGKLVVYLENDSSENVPVNKRFAIGPTPSGDLTEVSLIIRANGKTFPFSAKIRIGPPASDDVVMLSPGALVGRAYPLEHIIDYYELEPGTYEIVAVYKSNKIKSRKVYAAESRSNPLTVRVAGN